MTEKKNTWIDFIITHDDSKIFMILYIGLAVILSVFISLFWLLAVVGIHLIFEIIKHQKQNFSFCTSFSKGMWEIKLDIALLLFAVVLSLYMNVIFGIVGIGAATRAVAQTGARFAAWQRAIRGILLSLDDVAQVVRFGMNKKTQRTNEKIHTEKPKNTDKKIGVGDIISLSLIAVFTLLIVFSPFLTSHSYHDVFQMIYEEFKPFP